MDFVTGVNRLLRINQIIGGDDDDMSDFTDTQHAADSELAQIAIQSELTLLVADKLIPYEKTSSTLSMVTGTRIYAMPADFVRFYGNRAQFYDSVTNTKIWEYVGGEDALRDHDYTYKTATGNPWAWYWDDTTSKKVGFYSVPESSYNGRSFYFDYEKTVAVTLYSDTLPFHNEMEAQSFIACAARRFKFMEGSLQVLKMEEDAEYSGSMAALLSLMKPTNPAIGYGRSYG